MRTSLATVCMEVWVMEALGLIFVATTLLFLVAHAAESIRPAHAVRPAWRP